MINLLPELYKLQFTREYRWRIAVVLLFFVDAVIMAGVVLLMPSYLSARGQVQNAVVQPKSAQQDKDLHTGLLAQTSALSSTLKALSDNANVPTPTSFTDMISTIVADKTSSISITGITYGTITPDATHKNAVTIHIQGVAADRDSLAQFVSVLKAEKKIASTEVPISAYASDTNLPFTITILGN